MIPCYSSIWAQGFSHCSQLFCSRKMSTRYYSSNASTKVWTSVARTIVVVVLMTPLYAPCRSQYIVLPAINSLRR